MPQETAILQQTDNTFKSKNTLLIILIILVVALFGILIGLVAFLLTTRNNNQVSNSSSSISTSTSILANTSVTTNSINSSTSVSSISSSTNSTTSSSISFSHNEGKYIRFDYPTGWKVDVQSKRSDGTFTKFEDIAQVTISNGETALMFSGYGQGCMGGETQYLINNSNTLMLQETLYKTDNNNNTSIDKVNNVNISNFKSRVLNINSASGYALINYIKEGENIMKVVRYENNTYKFSECIPNTIFLNNNIFGQATHLLVYANDPKVSIPDLATIIEHFANSFQKK